MPPEESGLVHKTKTVYHIASLFSRVTSADKQDVSYSVVTSWLHIVVSVLTFSLLRSGIDCLQGA